MTKCITYNTLYLVSSFDEEILTISQIVTYQWDWMIAMHIIDL